MSSIDRQPRMALALAGGGPLGAIYEIGTLMALAEALDGFDFNDLDAYVGVSAGGFIAAGLANGLSPAYLYRMFIDSDSAEFPFEPEMLLKPAFGEYAGLPLFPSLLSILLYSPLKSSRSTNAHIALTDSSSPTIASKSTTIIANCSRTSGFIFTPCSIIIFSLHLFSGLSPSSVLFSTYLLLSILCFHPSVIPLPLPMQPGT